MTSTKQSRRSLVAIFITMLLCFIIFVLYFHQHQVQQQHQAMMSHAKVIEMDLWSYDSKGPEEYLSLASIFNRYSKITIMDHNGEEFLSVNGPSLGRIDQFFEILGMLPVTVIAVDINHGEEKIGQLIATHQNKNIYVYCYVFIFLLISYVAIVFFLRTTYVKYQLEKNELNRVLFDYTPLETIVVDEDGKIISFNQAVKSSENTMPKVGQVMYKEYASKHAIDMYAEMMKCITTGQSKKFTNIPYDEKFLNIILSNFPNGAIIVCQDVTEQTRLEEMMVQNEKMMSLGGLAAGMAHEVNNPLAGIMQTVAVVNNRLTNVEDTANITASESAGTTMSAIQAYMEQRGIMRMLDSINASGERMAEIVENMLSFARKSEDGFDKHNLNTLLDKSLDLSSTDYDLKKQYDFKAVEIIKEYDENLPLTSCDEGKIQQVFLNLLRNGAEAMQEAGTALPTITLHTRYDDKQGMVCVTIKDNGPGIDEKICKRIFEPFFTTKPIGVGTGLGLSVSYFIITENHAGEMMVDSELGKGTTFLVKLPCNPTVDNNAS